MRDSYILSRTIYESLLNICYILESGDEILSDALTHSQYMIKYNAFKEVNINGVKVVFESFMKPELEDNERFKELERKKGAKWTKKDRQDRIAFLIDKNGRKAMQSFVLHEGTVYKKSADMAHGNLYGALLEMNIQENGSIANPQEWDAHQVNSIIMLYSNLSLLMITFLSILNKHTDVGDHDSTLQQNTKNLYHLGVYKSKQSSTNKYHCSVYIEDD